MVAVAEPRTDGASAARVTAEVARSDSIRRLPARRATVEEYVGEAGGDADGMTAGRWGFLSRNHTADATRDPRALRGVPVLLVLAGHDVSVDTAETEDVYHQVLGAGRALTVERHPDATHSPSGGGRPRRRAPPAPQDAPGTEARDLMSG
ncbi:hypothetical protein [Streptomyces sp. NPDC001889]